MPTQIPGPVMGLLKSSIISHHRNMFVIIGDDSKELVPVIYSVSRKLRPPSAKPTLLWCYKSELGFSSNRKKRVKQLKKLKSRGLYDPETEDANFDHFATSTQVRWCYYRETEKILGQTFGFLVLQDFEALTPNLLARTIETVEGGGSIIFLLKTMDSLKRLYELTMDVHIKFTTVSNKLVRPRFNERFILSLGTNTACAVLDEEFSLLPLTKVEKSSGTHAKSDEDKSELEAFLSSLPSTTDGIMMSLASLAKTVDQAKAISVFVEAVSSKTLNYTISLTASRGRGKSAALGIALACAVAYGYSNIFLTAPSVDNLQTVFEFAVRALEALKFVEHTDFELISAASATPVVRVERHVSAANSSNPAAKIITRINIFRTHRQTIQYIAPTETKALAQAEMLVIDEAAAIPLPLVRQLLGPYLVMLSSTIDGYEGTGRSLSLKLFDELRVNESKNRRSLKEVTLQTPIRYGVNDPVEKWLYDLLCLDAKSPSLTKGTPHPDSCQLFLVDRDTLFSRHKVTEDFLRRVMGLMVASHYKNTPNDLQLLSDAPAHRLFVLLGPTDENETSAVPDVLCVAQIAFEGNIPGAMVREQLSQGNRSSGDMLPWTISQQFQEDSFAQLSGARVVRIATHQDTFSMGYGTRMLSLLDRYFKGEVISTSEDKTGSHFESLTNDEDQHPGGDEADITTERIKPRKKLNPLLVPAGDVPPPALLDYIGVSFGVTPKLFKFWNNAGYKPVYVRQTENTITGEYSCIMLKSLGEESFASLSLDFARRYGKLLSGPFRAEPTSLALAIIASGANGATDMPVDTLTEHDRKRLDAYSRNLVDHHLITDLLPRLGELYFFAPLEKRVTLSPLQQALLVGLGLQLKTVDDMSIELNLPVSQLLAMLNKAIRRFSKAPVESNKDADEDNGLETALKSVSSDIKPGTILSVPISEEQKKQSRTVMEKKSPAVEKGQPKSFERRSGKKHRRN